MYQALVVFHFLFICWVIAGGLLALVRPWLAWLHVPALVWAVLLEWMGWVCPLTPWENALRVQAGEATYEGGFIDHYLIPLIYPEDLTRSNQVVMGTVLLLFNVVVYFIFIRRLSIRRHHE